MSEKFIRAGVIGYPVGHSLSPLIHTHWIVQYGLQGSYEAIAIAPDDLAKTLPDLFAQGYAGFNVTIPHKQAIMALCDDIDDAARAIGAVNTLALDGQGRIRGSNTDWTGFINSILEDYPDFDFASGPAIVLGAGGAARAVIAGLQNKGAKDIRLANRTLAKAQALADEFGIAAVAWEEREAAARDAALLVNTTALGMKGQGALDFDTGVLPETALVTDIVYNPRRTVLLQDAEARGLKIVEGLGMLLHQARPAFAQWFGVMPEVTPALRQKIQEVLP